MRKPVVAANWKMNKTVGETLAFIQEFLNLIQADGTGAAEVVLCPPFTSLAAASRALANSGVALGAQNMFWEAHGSYTGEISPLMLKDLGCSYVILGHSERRQWLGETDQMINRKLQAALEHGLTPILCVGEQLEERERGDTRSVVRAQIEGALAGVNKPHLMDRVASLVVAYEPVWAIGTGRAATGSDANEVAGFIRQVIAELMGSDTAQGVRIQYGGSVKPENIAEFMQQPEIDGALVGGASLDPRSFARLVKG